MIFTDGLCPTPGPPIQTGARVVPLDPVPRLTDVITPGVHHVSLGAVVRAVPDQVQRVATNLAAVTGPRPTAIGHTLHRGSAQQLVATVTGHLTAGAQGAAVVPSTGGVAGHIPICQAQKVTPSWIPVVQSGSIVLLLWNNLIVAAVQCGSRA